MIIRKFFRIFILLYSFFSFVNINSSDTILSDLSDDIKKKILSFKDNEEELIIYLYNLIE